MEVNSTDYLSSLAWSLVFWIPFAIFVYYFAQLLFDISVNENIARSKNEIKTQQGASEYFESIFRFCVPSNCKPHDLASLLNSLQDRVSLAAIGSEGYVKRGEVIPKTGMLYEVEVREKNKETFSSNEKLHDAHQRFLRREYAVCLGSGQSYIAIIMQTRKAEAYGLSEMIRKTAEQISSGKETGCWYEQDCGYAFMKFNIS
ncbi:hypothetical protein ACP26I_21210 (plasmid) [Cronobacter sakazakii]